MKRAAVCLLLCIAAVVGLVSGAASQAAAGPPKPVPPVVIWPTDPLSWVSERAVLLPPWQHGNLTIYPVRLPEWPAWSDVMTMDEAMSRNVLTISETGSVNDIWAYNRGGAPIFMMAGEMIGGAKQDRMLRDDVLLPGHSKLQIPVYCVEHGRWIGSQEFHTQKRVVTAPMRQTARASRSQDQVWSGVAAAQAELGVRDKTTAFSSVYQDAEVQRKAQAYVEDLKPLIKRERGVCGVIVVSGGEFVVADLFHDEEVFEALWPKLLDSYAVSALQVGRHGDVWRTEDARRLLRRIVSMRRTHQPTPGAGELLELDGAGMLGQALLWKQSVVHLELFPGARIMPMERREPRLPSPQVRRDRLQQRIR
jgi:hypothetical protein